MSALQERVYSRRYGRQLLIRRWVPSEIAIVREMAGQGFSSTEIGDELGVTRNMIIGVCGRNNIVLDRKNRHRLARGPKRRPIRIKVAPTIVPEPKPDPVVETPGKTFLELARGECHWPLGDPLQRSEFWCGQPAQPTRPYCRHHCRMAYRVA